MKLLAQFISVITHPLLVPTYLFLTLGRYQPVILFPFGQESFVYIIWLIFFSTFAIPAFLITLLKSNGLISSFTLVSREQRIIPFFVISLFYLLVTIFIKYRLSLDFNDNFLKILVIINLMVISSLLLTLFAKISIHSLSISGLSGILFASILLFPNDDSLLFLNIIFILILGFTASSRLYLQAHTKTEVWVGISFGFVFGFLESILLLTN